MRMGVKSVYLGEILTGTGMRNAVKDAVSRLRPFRDEFEAVAFRGISGALIAPSVAQCLKKDIIVVRKNETRHSGLQVEGPYCERYIIVDDFISSGETIQIIKDSVEKADLGKTLVGVFMYNEAATHPSLKEFSGKNGNWVLHRGTREKLTYKESYF